MNSRKLEIWGNEILLDIICLSMGDLLKSISSKTVLKSNFNITNTYLSWLEFVNLVYLKVFMSSSHPTVISTKIITDRRFDQLVLAKIFIAAEELLTMCLWVSIDNDLLPPTHLSCSGSPSLRPSAQRS